MFKFLRKYYLGKYFTIQVKMTISEIGFRGLKNIRFRFKESQKELLEMKTIRLFLMIAFCMISIICRLMTLFV